MTIETVTKKTPPRLKGSSYRVPFVDPREHYSRLKTEIDEAIIGCLSNGDLIQRRQLADFEGHLADYLGVKYGVGLNSGYHALHFSLVAIGVGPGDEVVTVGHTFVATLSAIVHCGARPVLVDIREDFNIDPDLLEAAITPRTKAIIPVHLNGRCCDMDRVMEIAQRHKLRVVEDAAQACGATFKGKMAGSFGDTGCFSFYPFKALGGFGDGGALVTNDPEIAKIATLLRFNGEDRNTGEYYYHGQTALLDNVQAAVLDVKLRYFPKWVAHRRQIAQRYFRGLRDIPDLSLPHFEGDVWRDSYQNYVIRSPKRDELRSYLAQQGVETLISWPKPTWHHKALKLGDWNLPITERICREILSLPMSAETTQEHVDITVETLRHFFAC